MSAPPGNDQRRPAGESGGVEAVGGTTSSIPAGYRRCKVRGCPGRYMSGTRCGVCRHYPKGFSQALRLFNESTPKRARNRGHVRKVG